jgi:hypothetical protein
MINLPSIFHRGMDYPILTNMFGQQSNPRKRALESDEEFGFSGFSAHRAVRLPINGHHYETDANPFKKRQMAALPHRTSPRQPRQPFTGFGAFYPQQPPAPPTITPADSDSEETPAAEPKSFFSPYSSSPTQTLTPSSPCLDAINSSQSTQMSDAGLYSDDCEMADSVHLSPGSFQNDPSTSISSRIPTPIHSSFYIRDIRAEKAHRHTDPDFADDESMVDRIRRGKRLPSPISEGEMSPSVIVEGLEDMQMEVERERETPTKKGHSRSKHSLRNWTGSGGESGNGIGMKRSFTMGYRSDCEKCQNKVPGHFSHIITH